MRILYVDAFSGASGDMILGALLDAGVPLSVVEEEVRKLPVGPFEIRVTREARHGIQGTRVVVEIPHASHAHRAMRDIRVMLEASPLDPAIRDLSLRIFVRLAEAEGKVHGAPPATVTFHEVGAVDSIVDIVGAAKGFHWLGPVRVLSSPLPLGHGFVKSQHGVLPVPAPATLEILRDVPVSNGGVEGEMVTPTGAAILREVAEGFGPLPPVRVERIGYGVGHRDPVERPNLLRFLLGEAEGFGFREDWLLEANIDDMNPEFCEHLTERLLAEGALDVTWSPLIMKKSRPGVMLRVLTDPDRRDASMDVILRESTSIGVRFFPVRRRCLERVHEVVETPWGAVRIKVSSSDDEILNALPEYQDCREIAVRTGVPLKEIYLEAVSVYRRRRNLP
jgi:pyridinium-3,5-bisthiocarboxylic acid mononucleotide nickel chelatase